MSQLEREVKQAIWMLVYDAESATELAESACAICDAQFLLDNETSIVWDHALEAFTKIHK